MAIKVLSGWWVRGSMLVIRSTMRKNYNRLVQMSLEGVSAVVQHSLWSVMSNVTASLLPQRGRNHSGAPFSPQICYCRRVDPGARGARPQHSLLPAVSKEDSDPQTKSCLLQVFQFKERPNSWLQRNRKWDVLLKQTKRSP